MQRFTVESVLAAADCRRAVARERLLIAVTNDDESAREQPSCGSGGRCLLTPRFLIAANRHSTSLVDDNRPIDNEQSATPHAAAAAAA